MSKRSVNFTLTVGGVATYVVDAGKRLVVSALWVGGTGGGVSVDGAGVYGSGSAIQRTICADDGSTISVGGGSGSCGFSGFEYDIP